MLFRFVKKEFESKKKVFRSLGLLYKKKKMSDKGYLKYINPLKSHSAEVRKIFREKKFPTSITSDISTSRLS